MSRPATSLPSGRRRRSFRSWRARRSRPPATSVAMVFLGMPVVFAASARATPSGPPMRRWRILTKHAIRHVWRSSPPRHARRCRGHRSHPGRRSASMTVMAGCEDRQSDQDQRGNQAAPPPAILPYDLVLDTLETSFEVARFFARTSSAASFFRYQGLPPLI